MSDSDSFTFCPVCQLPLKAISISPELHVSQCMSRCDDNEKEECCKGVHCLSTDVFHYRDFSHKLLATYRSSADFVPPTTKIKPSPKKKKTPVKPIKRSSPRKTRSSSKNEKKHDDTSESDSEILVQAKRPRRNLNFGQKNNPTEKGLKINPPKSSQIQNKNYLLPTAPIKSTKQSTKLVLSKEDDADHEENHLNGQRQSEEKLNELNIKLNAGKEIRFSHTNSRSHSPLSSISVSTTLTSQFDDSDFDSETSGSIKQNTQTKVVLKEPVLKFDVLNSSDNVITSVSKNLSKDQSTLEIHKKLNDEEDSSFESETNVSLSKTDFDDVIPGSMLDKELLKTIERKLESPATTLHSCSEYNDTSTSVSSEADDRASEGKESVLFTDPPSSPEVIIPKKSSRSNRTQAFLTSSSDSDLPLASLVKTTPTLGTSKKDNTIKGMMKAGKMLRSPNKTPVYLNGLSLKLNSDKSDVNASSEVESDSGKSSGSKDSSFVPSDKSSESQHSDSAFSAESTDRLTSSAISSNYSSSEANTYESALSDPSFSEGSDYRHSTKSRRKSGNSNKIVKKSPLTPKRNKHLSNILSLHSDSSSSSICMREKLFFGGKKKSPTSVTNTVKAKESNLKTVIPYHRTIDNGGKTEWQSLLSKMRSDSFPSDLKIDSEDSLTVASSCSSSDSSHTSMMLPPKQCPFYKKIPNTPFAVDAFQYWNIPGVKVYFLSHFHSDHYIGLKKSFSHPIYCTKITANLVRQKLRVDEKWLRILELNKPEIICGVEVTTLDANHCPGSVMFLFSLTNGRNYLHVGDFRACKRMTMYPSLQKISISALYLDTTYCSPQYCFPTQEEVIGKVIDIVRDHVKSHPRTLVVCGSYTIGKEKVFLGIAEALNWNVWARPDKQRVFACLDNTRINSRLVKDPRSANVHVLPMGSIHIQPLQQHWQSCSGSFTHVIGVKPTGWELNSKSHDFKVTHRDNITVFGVPYSEHSSFTELRQFVQFLQPHEVVPTVNTASAASRAKMSKYFSEWLNPSGKDSSEKQTKVSQYFKKS